MTIISSSIFIEIDSLIHSDSVAHVAVFTGTLVEQFRLAMLLGCLISIQVVKYFDDLLTDEFVFQDAISRFTLLQKGLRQNCI